MAEEYGMKRRPLGRYGLGWVLLALFLASWVVQTWTGWIEFKAEQHSQGQAAQVFGPDGYVWAWSAATFENWQSEFLQLLTMVALTSVLIFTGSPESKDSDEEMQEALRRIEERLAALDRAAATGAPVPWETAAD
jgi:hypothetical protein